MKAETRAGASIGMDPGGGMVRWWSVTLECGHEVERPIRFPKQIASKAWRRGWGAIYHKRPLSEALSPPKRCRCEYCPKVGTDADGR